MDLAKEKSVAKENFDRLVGNIPSRLAEKEDRFAAQLKRAKTKPVKKLETLYSFMNQLYAHVSKYTPCKKGCSDCCYYSVTVSEVEISHIEKNTNTKRNKAFLPKANFHGSACPFLRQGGCSIYEFRPFVCRRHVTLTSTNTWCSPDVSNDEEFHLLSFSSVDEAFDQIRKESGSFEVFDIRQVFGYAAPSMRL